MKMKRIGLGLLTVLTVLLLSGCMNKITYKYHHGKDGSGVSITKAEYSEDSLKLHVKGLHDINEVIMYDADFNVLPGDYSYQYKNNVLTIKGPEALQISGLYIEETWTRYHIRYLDASNYALLYEVDATEIGWMLEGNKEKYYTEEELKEQKAVADQMKTAQEENFTLLEGHWVCTADSNLYIDVYRTSDGEKYIEWSEKEASGAYLTSGMEIAEITIRESYVGYTLEIVDNPYYGYQLRYEMSEDFSQIIDGQYNADDLIYVKEKQ